VFFSLIPLLLRQLNLRRAPHSFSKLDRMVMTSYYAFDVINVFLLSTFAGAIFNIIAQLTHHLSGSAVAELLGSSIAAQSDFFLNLILAYTFISYPITRLLRTPELVQRFMKVRKAKTETERLFYEQPIPRLYALFYTIELLIFTILITYSYIAPFLIFFGILFFCLAFVVAKYDAVYVATAQHYGKGKHFHVAFTCCIIGMLLAHVILFGVLALKDFPEVAAFAPLPIVTIAFFIYAKRRFRASCDFLPLERYGELQNDGLKFQHAYVDPAYDPRRQNIALKDDIPLSNSLEVGTPGYEATNTIPIPMPGVATV